MGMFAATEHDNTCIHSTFYTSYNSYAPPTDTIFPNTWHCIIFTFSNEVLKMYDNGQLIISQLIPTTLNNPYSLDSCTGGPLKLGVWWQNDPNFFVGTMDDSRLYGRVLNDEEITALCSNLTDTSGGWGNGGGDTTVSVRTVNGEHISLYPNPAGNVLHIDGIKDLPYSITDMTGRVLQQGRLTDERNKINISTLAQGTYFIQLHGDKAIRSRFIKL